MCAEVKIGVVTDAFYLKGSSQCPFTCQTLSYKLEHWVLNTWKWCWTASVSGNLALLYLPGKEVELIH